VEEAMVVELCGGQPCLY